MNAYKKRQKQKKRNGVFRKWHRRLGFVASLFLFNLAITGVLLNHYEPIELHKSYVTSDWLLDLYGIQPPQQAQCFNNEQNKLCQIDDFIYINNLFWRQIESPVNGFVENSQGLLIATSKEIFWLTPQLDLIDKLSIQESLPHTTLQWWSLDDSLVARTKAGDFQLNLDEMQWQPLQISDPIIEPLQAASSPIEASLSQDYRGRQISHLRLIQDLHSGRLIGLTGQITNDLTALILLWLSISGFVTWKRRLKKHKD